MKAGYVVLAVAALFVVFGWNERRITRAEVEAESLRLEAEAEREARAEIETRAEQATDQYMGLRDSLDALAVETDSVRRELRRDVFRARSRADSLEQVVRSSLESLGASSTPLDDLVAEHQVEVQALEAEAVALESERAILWRTVERSDSLLALQEAVNQSLRREVAILASQADKWRDLAHPPLHTRLARHVPPLLVGVAVGLILSR